MGHVFCKTKFRAAVLLIAVAVGLEAAPRLDEGYAPVTVSSANYGALSDEELRKAVNDPVKLALDGDAVDVAPTKGPREPQYFIFAPGEGDAAEMTFEQVCALLTPALESQGFINAADKNGQLTRPLDEVALVLKVSFGTIPWRLPVVRTDDLLWRDGLRPKPKGGLSRTGGGEVAFDYRYGGTRDIREIAEGPGAERLDQVLGEFGTTRDTHLIVVDAFSYRQLQEKGMNARRLWTTMASAPYRRGERLADLAGAMVAKATPFFGETSRGLQVYPDVKTDVEIGEAEVVPEDDAGR